MTLAVRDPHFTAKQREVLDLLARKRTNAEIADELGISLDGAKWHVREVMSILGVDSRDDAAEYWRVQHGFKPRFARLLRGLFVAPAAKWIAGGATVALVGVTTATLVAIAVSQSDGQDGATSANPRSGVQEPRTVATAPAGASATQTELRDAVRICVDGAPSSGVDLGDLAQAIERQAASALAANPGANPGSDPDVSVGCPDGYVAPDPDVGRDPALPPVHRGVSAPSELSTFVFLVSDEEAHYLDPYGGMARRGYESMCEGLTCWEVTTALYISPSVLASENKLQQAVLVGLGLGSLPGDPNGHPPAWESTPKPGDP